MKKDQPNETTGPEPAAGMFEAAGSPTEETGPEAGPSSSAAPGPRRYKLYDRFADHVSLRTIDAVILISGALIIGLLIYGILTAG